MSNRNYTPGEVELMTEIIVTGSVSASDLAKIGFNRNTISSQLNRLAKRGCLISNRGIDDQGHKVFFSVTEKGHKEILQYLQWAVSLSKKIIT